MVLRSVAPGLPQDSDVILESARQWWIEELHMSEDYLRKRNKLRERGEWNGNYYGRPRLRDVLAALEAFKLERGYNHSGRT